MSAMTPAKAMIAQLEKGVPLKPPVPGSKPPVTRLTKPADAPPGVPTPQSTASSSPASALRSTGQSTEGGSSSRSPKTSKATWGAKPSATAVIASTKATESTTQSGDKPSWAQRKLGVTGVTGGGSGLSQLANTPPTRPTWSKPSSTLPPGGTAADNKTAGDSFPRKPLKSTIGSPGILPPSSAEETKATFGRNLKPVVTRGVAAAQVKNSSEEDAENITPAINAGNQGASNADQIMSPDSSNDANSTKQPSSEGAKPTPRPRKPSKRSNVAEPLSPDVHRLSPGLEPSPAENTQPTEQERDAVATDNPENENRDELQDEHVHEEAKPSAVCANDTKGANHLRNALPKKQETLPAPGIPKRQPTNVGDLKSTALPAIPPARLQPTNTPTPPGLQGKQPLAAPPSPSADIVTDQQGRRYRRLPKPKAESGRPPRKLAKPPSVDLSRFATGAGLARTSDNIVAEEAELVDDDELYTDATSSTQGNNPPPVIGGQYVTDLTRRDGAKQSEPQVAKCQDDEIYEEL